MQAAARDTLIGLAARTPLLAGADVLTFVDIDSMLRRVCGKQKQGIGFGHAKVGGYNVRLRGYNPLVATLSTPLSAPVVAATPLRSGNAGPSRGAARMIAETITTARSCGATGEIVQAVWDDDAGRWISDAQIAETTYTAFAGTRHQVTARLIVRRIRRDDPTQHPDQEELVPAYRYHAVFTDSPTR